MYLTVQSIGVRAIASRCALWLTVALASCASGFAEEADLPEAPSVMSAGAGVIGGCQVRPQDEVWVIDCRGLCVVAPDVSVAELRYEQYLPGEGWVARQAADFLRQPADMVTSFFIVGNYYTHQETIEAGWYAYHRLVAACADDVRLRFVIWSWPSDPVPGRRLPDAKVKLRLVDPTAYHLAAIIDAMSPATPVSMCGSSFGVGVALGAVQFLAVGRLDCYKFSPRTGAVRQVRIVFLGAAVDHDVFLPGHKFDAVLPYLDRALVLVNPRDRALRVYRLLFGHHSGYLAMGRVGPEGLAVLSDGWKVDLLRSDPYLGHKHGMRPNWRSPPLVATMRPYLLMQPLPPVRDLPPSLPTLLEPPSSGSGSTSEISIED